MQAAAGRPSASEPLAISIEGEADREQLASSDHAEELAGVMELRFSPAATRGD